MPNWISPTRVRIAIANLFDWRHSVKSQPAMHLWPLLALIEHGVNTETPVRFTEQDDRSFWERFARLSGEARLGSSTKPFTPYYYIDPLSQELKPSDHPHRGPSSIRVRTFLRSWKAAEHDEANEEWKLKPEYSAIFEEKVLSRGDTIQRIPIIDLAAYLLREKQFPDNANATTLQERFLEVFPFQYDDYIRLFEFANEPADSIFVDTEPTFDEMNSAIREALLRHTPTGAMAETTNAIAETTVAEVLLEDDDVHLVDVLKLLELGSSGIILRGCPGTSKTWYAKQIARRLVNDPQNDIFQVQFHPSYGYEDFIEGYRPDDSTRSGFKIVNRILIDVAAYARDIDTHVVLIIDEINRGDPARVFGELLTYIEHGYRGIEFPTALSGKTIEIPSNLVIIGTMNPYDRSTLQFDLALVRRFDHINIEPDPVIVENFLTNTEIRPTDFTQAQISRITRWFSDLQKMVVHGGIGHTYFKDVKTLEDLRMVWNYRMLPYCENVLEIDPRRLAEVSNSFAVLTQALTTPSEEDQA